MNEKDRSFWDNFTDIGAIVTNVAAMTQHIGKGKEVLEKIVQQMPGIEIPGVYDDLTDEAIIGVGLRTAAMEHYKPEAQAAEAFGKLDAFVNDLEHHQKTRLRRVITSLKLTERFENAVEATTDKQGKKTEKPSRRQIDYEYTEKDPRVQFIINMAKTMMEAEGEKSLKDQLLAFEVILEKSRLETLKAFGTDTVSKVVPKAKKRVEGALEALLNGINGDTRQTGQPTDSFIANQREIVIERQRQIEEEEGQSGWLHLLLHSLPGRILIGMIVLIAILFAVLLTTKTFWLILTGTAVSFAIVRSIMRRVQARRRNLHP